MMDEYVTRMANVATSEVELNRVLNGWRKLHRFHGRKDISLHPFDHD